MTPAPHPPQPARPLGRVWLVANRASRSTDDGRIAALEAALQGAGAIIAGTTDFPRAAAPDAAALAGLRGDLSDLSDLLARRYFA